MELKSEIIKNYGNGYVQLEVGSNTLEPKYYKLPESKVDEFQSEFKKNKKKSEFVNGATLLGAIIVTIMAASALTKKMTNRLIKAIVNISAGVVGGILSIAVSNKLEQKSHKELMQKYDATPMQNPKAKKNA